MICDTSGLLAALWRDQPDSESCVAAIESANHLVISPLVLTEIDYLVGRRVGHSEAVRAMRLLSDGGFELATFDWRDVRAALDVAATYQDLGLGLVDASQVVLAKRYETHDILTLDQRHFRVVRSLSGRPFRILPFDAE